LARGYVSPAGPPINYGSSDADRAEALRLKRKKFIITGSVLLAVGLTCGILSPVAANGDYPIHKGVAAASVLGVVGLGTGVAGIALLGRSRGLKKEREKLLQPTIGIGYVAVRGRF
jgi:hypothetical protein